MLIELKGIKLFTDKEVYSPREDSMLLLKFVKVKENDSALDLGCGTGLIGILAAKQKATVYSADINPKALELTEKNAKENNVKIKTIKSNLFSDIKQKFDFIYFNPPYVIDEGKRTEWIDKALNGGKKGREVIDKFIPKIKNHLTKNGKCFLLQSDINGVKETEQKLKKQKLNYCIQGRQKLFFEELIVFKIWQK